MFVNIIVYHIINTFFIMKNRFSGLIMFVIIFSLFTPQNTQASSQMPSSGIFPVEHPDKKLSPYTGMTREHWLQTAEYLLQGAFSYINSIDDPMKFPKQFDKTYPHNDGGVVVEKLEGLCRTLFVANAVIKEYSDYTINNITVADYYRHQILNLINPESPSFFQPRGENPGPSQLLL